MLGYYKQSLLDAFKRLKEIQRQSGRSPEKSLELQMILIARIISLEKRIRRNKLHIETLRKDFSKTISMEVQIQKGQEIKMLKAVNLEYKRIISIFKAVGDGLAFIYLDKWDVKPLVFKESSGFISGKKGLSKELSILKGLYEDNKVSILNDITNCLRYGDITVPINGFPYVIEVKSSDAYTERTKRQAEKIKKVLNYLLTDTTEDLYGTGPMKRVNLHYPEKNYIKELNACIETSYKNGYCVHKVENGLFYWIEDRPDCNNFLDSIFSQITQPFVFFVNSIKHDALGYYPFTLSIAEPERLYDFYRGEFLITVIVDMSILSNKLLKKGIILQYQEGLYPLIMLNKSKSHNAGQFKVSEHYWGRIGFEFLSLNSFVKEIIKKVGVK